MTAFFIILIGAILGLVVAIIVSRQENKKHTEIERLFKETTEIVDKFKRVLACEPSISSGNITTRDIVASAFDVALKRLEKHWRGRHGHIVFISDVKWVFDEVLKDMDEGKR